jgi:hypothetical protein
MHAHLTTRRLALRVRTVPSVQARESPSVVA